MMEFLHKSCDIFKDEKTIHVHMLTYMYLAKAPVHPMDMVGTYGKTSIYNELEKLHQANFIKTLGGGWVLSAAGIRKIQEWEAKI